MLASERLLVTVPPVDVTHDGAAVSALKSWIPAGTIDRFIWSWVSRDPSKPRVPWEGIENEETESHSFLFGPTVDVTFPGSGRSVPRVPPWETYQLCLRVEGTQIGSKPGPPQSVSGGTVCQVEQPEWVAVVPSWWDAVLLAPVWGPDPGPEAVLEDAIVAHVNVRSATPPSAHARTTALIHFSGTQSEAALSLLGDAMLRSTHRNANVPVVLVLPKGAFAQRRTAVDRQLGAFPQELRAPLIVTEDYEGSWTRAFDVTRGEATYLLSGEGELTWSHQGRLDAASLSAALDQHVRAGPRRRSRPVRLAVQAGAAAPEVVLDDGRGARLSMTQLRGRRIVLMFWKSSSRSCLTELGRLQQVSERGGRHAPVIMAIGDGEHAERTAAIGREHHLRFSLVPDPDRRIARAYGVNCWPTIVSIDEHGVIDAVHSGITHDLRR